MSRKRVDKGSVILIGSLAAVALVAVSLVVLAIDGFPSVGDQRAYATYQMKQIGLALHLYHDDYKCLPPAFTADADGKPLHSWRVLILPYLEQYNLYDRFDLDQPWDSPHNLELAEMMPDPYVDHALRSSPGMTPYVAIVGPRTMLPTEGNRKFSDLDGHLSDHIFFLEDARHQVPWTQPVDISPEEFLSSNLDAGYYGGTLVGIADGSVRFFHNGDKSKLKPMVTIDGK
ncbi:DUF1559 domain-containing protein [bacterium]|nr:DUF1559 domain-containing protein [bacterium]